MPHASSAAPQREIRPAGPEHVGDCGKDDREAQPVEFEDGGPFPEASGSDEIAEGNGRLAPISVERVRIAHVVEEDAADEPDKEDSPADIFVGAEDLDEDG